MSEKNEKETSELFSKVLEKLNEIKNDKAKLRAAYGCLTGFAAGYEVGKEDLSNNADP